MPKTEYLVLRLYGPLAAWGDIACGDVRPTLIHPTKSAILGLLGAALGVRRSDEAIISKMRDSYGFAVSVEGRCIQIRDFHTVQSAKVNADMFKEYGSGYLTSRHRELSVPVTDMETSLTFRDYLCDVIYTVAVWIKDDKDVPYMLQEISDALKEPKFVPYMGRKSCVLSRPMEPNILSASDPGEAIRSGKFFGDSAKYAREGKLYVYNSVYDSGIMRYSDDLSGQLIYEGEWDIKAKPGDTQSSKNHISSEIYRDDPISRERWQFKPRRVKRIPFERRSE